MIFEAETDNYFCRKKQNMKLSLSTKTDNSTLSSKTINSFFPLYGTAAPDVPVFDPDKHMYIVDQHTSVAGNRSITYVAIGERLVIEVVLGLFHCWTIMNTIRLLVFDGNALKVVKTYEWEGTNYYSQTALHEKITELTVQFVMDNLELVVQPVDEEIITQARSLAKSMLELGIEDHIKVHLLPVLEAYCRQMNMCQDFVTK